jgi:hypothetical protein
MAIYKATAVLVLMYASEIWILTAKAKKKKEEEEENGNAETTFFTILTSYTRNGQKRNAITGGKLINFSANNEIECIDHS